jgi:hypothetical protein
MARGSGDRGAPPIQDFARARSIQCAVSIDCAATGIASRRSPRGPRRCFFKVVFAIAAELTTCPSASEWP